MNKILLLGGSAQQVIAIKTAKVLGYYTVLCDFLPNNPGRYSADKFYLISTTDKEAVLKVATDEQVDGVLAYASDPAAPTAAYVAEKLGLAGNSYQSTEILCNKDRFRAFLAENGFNTPEARGYSSKAEAVVDREAFKYPIIIKPVDSSGSKGATVLQNESGIEEALDFAFSFSRCHKVIVEEFIVKKHPYLIGGDIFVIDGEIVLWGLLNCHRDNQVNRLVPVGKSYPLELNISDIDSVKDTLRKMISKLEIRNGSMNIELIVDINNRVWPIDVGPRSGGNMIPDLLGDIFGADIAKMSIQAAMGEKVEVNIKEPQGFYATHNLHSASAGTYQDIYFSDLLEKSIYRKCLYKKRGDSVEFFDNASKCLGIIFMRFSNHAEQKIIIDQIVDLYKVKLKNKHDSWR